ncbi:uncharacterized protein RHO17_011039 isoform 1-T3 [Thomomys bottae]
MRIQPCGKGMLLLYVNNGSFIQKPDMPKISALRLGGTEKLSKREAKKRGSEVCKTQWNRKLSQSSVSFGSVLFPKCTWTALLGECTLELDETPKRRARRHQLCCARMNLLVLLSVD